jgi:hypothetical protein
MEEVYKYWKVFINITLSNRIVENWLGGKAMEDSQTNLIDDESTPQIHIV